MSKHGEYTSVDELIKRALVQKAAKDNDIDIEAAWEKFKKKYPVKKRKQFPKVIAVACSICFILVVSGLFLPTEGKALSSKFFQSIKSFIGGKVQTAQVSFSSKKKQESTENLLTPEVSSALRDVSYDILLPVEAMGTYKIERAETNDVGKSKEVNLFLKGQNSELITITELNIIGDFNQGTSYDTEDASMKKANVNGQEANIVIYKNGFTKLSWIDRDIFISISGQASEDNILMLANSMRRLTLH